jgi:hypothetical protein
MGLVNTLGGNSLPIIQSATPAAPSVFNQYWVNTTSGAVLNQWMPVSGGASGAWVTSPAPGNLYIALLTTDPVAGGAVWLGDGGFTECQTAGYSRQLVDFTAPTAAYPSASSNTAVLTFGPMSATMIVPVQWAALVTSASGTGGYFLASWQLGVALQVDVSQSIQCGIGQLILQGQ